MVAIGDRIEMLALPFDEVVVLLVHFLAYGLPKDACADVDMRNGAMPRLNLNLCRDRCSIPKSRIPAACGSREEFFRYIRREPRARAVAVPRSARRSRRRMSSRGPRDRASGILPGRTRHKECSGRRSEARRS